MTYDLNHGSFGILQRQLQLLGQQIHRRPRALPGAVGFEAEVADPAAPRRDDPADRADFRAIGRVLAPWGRRIGDLRFETEGAWKGTTSTVDSLAKELRLALMYPEGAAV